MKIYSNLLKYNSKNKLSLTIGIFDGIHRGHQAVINFLNNIAAESNSLSALFTFNPPPIEVLYPKESNEFLTIFDEKVELLEKESLDFLFIQTFDSKFRDLTAEEFIKTILIDRLNIGSLIIGYDHKFGKNGEGDYEKLQKLSKQYNFNLYRLEAFQEDGEIISSTLIRNLIKEGKIKDANKKLGYSFFMNGIVIKGDQIGRKLGYPTANMEIDKKKIRPKNGVYFVRVKVDNQLYRGMMNIGVRPTLNKHEPSIEVNIFDFDRDIYGEEITVYFYDRNREEIKFTSLEELIQQLNRDKEKTVNYFDRFDQLF